MWRFLRLFWYLLNHPQVGSYKKLILVGFPILYLTMPDLVPFIIDDLIIIALGFWSFVKTAKRDVKMSRDKDIIDVEARTVKDD